MTRPFASARIASIAMSAALLWLLLLGMVSATSGAPRAAPLPAPAPGLPL